MGAINPEEEEDAAEADSAWDALEEEEEGGAEVILACEGGGMHCSQ
jgi:hypothetical protein